MGTCPNHILEQILKNVLFLNIVPTQQSLGKNFPCPKYPQKRSGSSVLQLIYGINFISSVEQFHYFG